MGIIIAVAVFALVLVLGVVLRNEKIHHGWRDIVKEIGRALCATALVGWIFFMLFGSENPPRWFFGWLREPRHSESSRDPSSPDGPDVFTSIFPALRSSAPPPSCKPAGSVVVVDVSASMDSAGLAINSPQPLRHFLNLLSRCGGELAFGLIGEGWTRDPVHLRIPAPPPQQNPSDLLWPGMTGPRKRNEIRKLAEQDSARYAAWAADARDAAKVFWASLDSLLDTPVNRNLSPVCVAVEEMDEWILERSEDPAWSSSWLVLITDGEDTGSRNTCAPVRSRSRVVLVNPQRREADLIRLHPKKVRTVKGAVDHIVRNSR